MSYINKSSLTENFSTLPNEIANNETLSLKAKGILWYLLSKPADWKAYIKDIAQHSKDGIKSVRTGVNELIKEKYMVRTTERDNGVITDWVYYVYDKPLINPEIPLQAQKVEVGFVEVGKGTLLNTDSNKTEDTKYISYKKEYILFLQGFNSVVGSAFKGSDKVFKQFEARMKEGYTLKEIAQAVQNASGDTYLMGKNENDKRYLTPEYILRANKLDQWLNAKPKNKKGFQLVS